jgi:L-fuculose-phosphate aldolase
MISPETAAHRVISVGRSLHAAGLVWGRSGNISRRLGVNSFLITASGADLGALAMDDLARCSITAEAHDGPPPSSETSLHRAIYQSRMDVQAIIHSSPFFTTLAACSKGPLPLRTDLFPEAMVYLGLIAWVPYHRPGSEALAGAVAAQAATSESLILANHGAVILGRNLDEALLRLEALEYLCRLEITARASGLALRYLGEKAAQDIAAAYGSQPSPGPEVASC